MNMITAIVFGLTFTVAYGTQCVHLSGKWRNELGSVMILHELPNSEITGWYRTNVVSSPGAAAIVSNITGATVPVKDGSLLAFSVLFNHGLSLASWVGECMVCDGKETIFTTYIYRRHSSKHTDEWVSTIINQNTFWREEHNDTIPKQNLETSEEHSKPVISKAFEGAQNINGEWISSTGEKVEFTEKDTNNGFVGKNQQATSLIGQMDSKDGITAFGFVSASSKAVKAWAGYLSEHSKYTQKKLRTSWLEHSFNSNCKDPRKIVHFGMEDYIHVNSAETFSSPETDTFFEKIRKFFKSLF